MKLGLAQMDIIWENKEENVNKVEKFIQEAVRQKIDCLLFPEMSLTGFSMSTEKIGESYSNLQTIAIVSKLCAHYNIFVGIGYVEKSNTKSLNKYAVINAKGEIVADYAKIHPFSFGEEGIHYIGGEKIEYCDIKDILTTPFICYDLRFPEIFQIASKRSQLITIAANWPVERREHWITLLKARAIENQCYIAGVNRFGMGNGLYYNGDSMIINPIGEIISDNLIGEGIVSSKISSEAITKYRNEFHLKDDRREELYKQL